MDKSHYRFETPGGNELLAERNIAGSWRVMVVDANGKRQAADDETTVAFENFVLADTVSSRASDDALAQWKRLCRFGDPAELSTNSGFAPMIRDMDRTKAFARQSREFAENFLKKALHYADHTVRHDEAEARAWLADVEAIQINDALSH